MTDSIIPYTFEYYWQPPAPVYDPGKAKKLLAEAGYADGFDAGEYLLRQVVCELWRGGARQPSERSASARSCGRSSARPFSTGIRTRSRSRASSRAASGAFGNAATRLEAAFVVKGGAYAYGNYPDIDALFQQQAAELDHKKRGGDLWTRCSSWLPSGRSIAPIWQLAFINGVGPRVGESGFGLIPGFAYTGPFEDITIKCRLAGQSPTGAGRRKPRHSCMADLH